MPAVESGPRPLLSFAGARRGKSPEHLADPDAVEKKDRAAKAGSPAFRADQLSRHYFEHFDVDPERMTNLPAREREELVSAFPPPLLTKVRDLIVDRGLTIKSLWRMFDGAMVETALMKYPDKATPRTSSQAGCGMACPLCVTGQGGLTCNLSAGEIVEQAHCGILAVARGDLGEPCRLTNVVFMGMGESLANWKQVLKALRRVIEPLLAGFDLSVRNVTASTVGMAPFTGKLAEQGIPVTLVISLRMSDDELRGPLIPTNSRFNVDRLPDAARFYSAKTGRRVSIEYALVRDMNDHKWRAQLLTDESSRRGRGWAYASPTPLSPIPGSIWTASTPETQNTFVQTLLDAGILTTIHNTRGSNIDGTCGQLTAEVMRFSARATKATEVAELARRGSETDRPKGVSR